jgi:hypothetical protein
MAASVVSAKRGPPQETFAHTGAAQGRDLFRLSGACGAAASGALRCGDLLCQFRLTNQDVSLY